MTAPKDDAPQPASKTGRQTEHAATAMQQLVQILERPKVLPHISSPVVDRYVIAKATGVHPDTVTRRLRAAGIPCQVVLGADRRAHAVYATDAVRAWLETRSKP